MRALWALFCPSTRTAEVYAALEELLRQYSRQRPYEVDLLSCDPEYGALLQPWFNSETFREIAFLILAERQRKNAAVSAALRIALSATLKAATAQDKGWGCIADNMLPKPVQRERVRHALSRCARNWTLLLRGTESARRQMTRPALEAVAAQDATKILVHGDSRIERAVESAKVDLVVSSPPYPNMTDYATSQRLSYYLLQSRPDNDFRSEIGARRRRKRRDALDVYREDMRAALSLVVEQMRDGAYACFVMPRFATDSANDAARRRAVDECLTVLVDHGLTQVNQLERALPARRRHHNQRWTTLERETIHVYRKM